MNLITAYMERMCAAAAATLMVTVALIAFTTTAAAQPHISLDGIGGTYYMVAFPDTVANKLMAKFPNTRVKAEASIWIFSLVDNVVTVTVGSARSVLSVEAGKFTVYTVQPWQLVNKINSPVARTISVTSKSPIILTCYLATIQGTEAWTPLPVEAWGTQYQAAAIPGEIVNDINGASTTAVQITPKEAPAEITIIAAFDSTTVTLTPPPGRDFEGSPLRTIRLNQGQAYQVRSRVEISDPGSQEDLASTTIIADKPIGVISGNTRAQVTFDQNGIANNVYKNLMIEWMPPYELLGQDFVYLPTFDEHRPGIGAPAERSREFVRVYNHLDTLVNGFFYQPGGTTKFQFIIKKQDLRAEFSFGTPTAAYIHTDAPTMAMMHSSSIVQVKSTSPQSYNAWAPYMVTLAPRSKWASFAPYYAPPNPGGMVHYINVVTDTLSAQKITMENGAAFPFNQKIAGTDLIWGSMTVTPGANHWLVGKDSAKFWGFVYGLLGGSEELRPNEFEEYNAVSYGYPLVSSHNLAGLGDTLNIDTSSACSTLTVTIRAINASPVGLRSVRLTAGAINTQLLGVTPADPASIGGLANVVVRVEPLDLMQPAVANLVITDRTGKTTPVLYSYLPYLPTLSPARDLNFGFTSLNTRLVKRVKITNTRSNPLVIRTVRLRQGNQGYSINSTLPAGPASQPPHDVTLASGDSMIVMVALQPVAREDSYLDTLEVNTPCLSTPLGLSAEYGEPIIYVGDLDFGTFRSGVDGPKTLPLEICNIGGGVLQFGVPDSTHLIDWLLTDFTLNPADFAMLKDTILVKNQCITIHVTFTPRSLGLFQTTARLWANTRDKRDTSVWTAQVFDPTLGVPGSGAAGNDLAAGTIGSNAIIRYDLVAPADIRLDIYDGVGRFVASLAGGHMEAGARVAVWDAAGQPDGVYYCRMTAGSWSRTVPIAIQR